MTTLEAFTKINADQALAEKVKNECKTPEQIFEALKAVGLTDDFETFKKAATELNASAGKMTEADVDAVVGGGTGTITTLTTTTTVTLAASGAV